MGRFLVGFVIGLLIGAGAVVLAGPRSGRPQGIGDLVDATMSAARRASELKQQEMWANYRSRVAQASQPRLAPQTPWEPYER